jgi:hypothetical protein
MLAPLLLLWPMSLGLTWVVAQAIANRPYDRELADLVRSLARQASAVQAAQGHAAIGHHPGPVATHGRSADAHRRRRPHLLPGAGQPR